MQAYTSEQLRNIVLMGHSGSGKTTLTEAALLASGAVTRMGRVEDGNTVADFDEQEHLHHYSIATSIVPVEWEGRRLNLLDTPGYPDFEGEVVAAATAADAALIAVDAASALQGGADLAWEHADAAGPLPRMLAVTRLDREHADFGAAVEALRARFGPRVAALTVPVGAAAGCTAVIDVVEGRLFRGAVGPTSEVPAEVASLVATAREQLVEAVCEHDDELMSRYLDGEEVEPARLRAALASAVCAGAVVPVFALAAGAPGGPVGVRALLDAVVEMLPSPLGREHALEEGTSVTTRPDGPLLVRVFKTTADPFVGRLTFMRVLSGTLRADASPYNVQHAAAERLGHLFLARGKEQIAVPELVAGDIGIAAKLAVTATGDTLVASEAQRGMRLPSIAFPEPTHRSALHLRTKADVDKLSHALTRITEQDPTIHVARDPDTGETVLTTLGDAQVQIAAARLEKVFGVAVDVTAPRVPYRETVTAPVKSEYRHKKQSGGHGQYGHVVIEVAPAPRGDGFAFVEQVVGGTLPKQFIPAVEKGIVETLPAGPLAHAPVVDVRVTLLDGSSHAVDSSEMAFKLAASQALKQGILQARPILLEPMMRLSLEVPADRVGDVMSDLNGRRGHVHGVDSAGPVSHIEAQAPLAEVQRYATDLRALTHGRGRMRIAPSHYAEVPANVQEQVLKQLATFPASA